MGKGVEKLRISRKIFLFVSIALFVIVSLGIVSVSNPSLNLLDIFRQTGLAISKSGESPAQFTEGVWTDLSDTDPGYWAWANSANQIALDSENNLIYTASSPGAYTYKGWSFGRYNLSSENWTEMLEIDPYYFSADNSGGITSMVFSPKDNSLYFSVSNYAPSEDIQFGKYNLNNNSLKNLSYNLISIIRDMAIDPSNESIYAIADDGKFGRYNISSGSWTDLSATDTGNWMISGSLYNVEVDSLTGLVYTGGVYGKLGVYNSSSNVWTDLRTVALNDWSLNNSITSIAVDSEKGRLYLGTSGSSQNFGVYNISDGAITDLSTKDPDNWMSTSGISSIVFDSVNNLVYTFGSYGKMGVYDPETDIWTNLSNTDEGDWIGSTSSSSLSKGVYDSGTDSIYFVGTGVYDQIFGVYNPELNTSTSLANHSFGEWARKYRINSISVNPNNGLVYTGLDNGKFGVYNTSLNTWTDLSSLLPRGTYYPYYFLNVYDVEVNPNNNLVYTALNNGKFGFYNESSGTWTNLSSSISYSQAVEEIALDLNNGLVYTGLYQGGFGFYNESSGTWTNLTATLPATFDWDSYGFEDIKVNPNNDLVYFFTGSRKFGVYNLSANTTTDLTLTNTSNWYDSFGNVVTSLAIDYDTNFVYTGFSVGAIGVYYPQNNTWTNVSFSPTHTYIFLNEAGATVTYSYKGKINSLTFDQDKDFIYAGFTNPQYTYSEFNHYLAIYLPSLNQWVDLSSIDPTGWAKRDSELGWYSLDNDIYVDIVTDLDSTNNLLYTGAAGGKFGVYSPSDVVYVSSPINGSTIWGSGKDNPLEINCSAFSLKNISEVTLYLNNSQVETLEIGDTLGLASFEKQIPNGRWEVKCSMTNEEGIQTNSSPISFNLDFTYPEPINYTSVINLPSSPSENLFFEMVYDYEGSLDPESVLANLTFEWSVMGINVENDTVLNVPNMNNTLAISYLNYSPLEGDWIELRVRLEDDYYNNDYIQNSSFMFKYTPSIHPEKWAFPTTTESYFYSLDCGETYCYAVNEEGSLFKINKATGEEVEGYPIPFGESAFYFLDCDDTYCYSMNNGYFFKINHLTGEQIYNLTEEYTNLLSENGMLDYSFDCDETYCYAGDYYGYFLKVNKLTGEQIFNTTEGSSVQLSSSEEVVTLTSCYADFCYVALSYHGEGYNPRILKLNKTSGEVQEDFTSYPILPPEGVAISSLSCDSDFCYVGNGFFNYINKVNTTSGEVFPSHLGPEVLDRSFSIPFWYCDEAYCYAPGSGEDYGYFLKVNKSSGVSVSGYPVRWFDTSVWNSVVDMECDDTYCYGVDNDLYFLKIEKFSEGEGFTQEQTEKDLLIANISIFNQDYYGLESISCDDTYCYGWGSGDNGGYFLKINHITGEQIYSDREEDINILSGNGIYNSISCDDTYCYGGDYSGYFLKINKITGEQIFNTSMETPISWSSNSISIIYCDDTYCYGGDYSGYFLKINKITGETLYTDSDEIRLTENGFYYDGGGITCDETYCYSTDYLEGYFLKVNHVTGEQIYNTTEGHTNLWSENGIYNSISCDETYCYSGDYNGYFLKINKITGEHVYNTTTDYNIRLSTRPLSDISCDETYCYSGDDQGYFIKVNKINGTPIYDNFFGDNFGGKSIPLGSVSLKSVFCDETYCYTVGRAYSVLIDYLVKLYKSPYETNETDNETEDDQGGDEDDQGEDNNNQGGGGGGGSSGKTNLTATSLNVSVTGNSTIITLSDSQAESGYSLLINVSDEIKLNSHNGKKNTIKLQNISKDTASFIIYPSAQAFNLKKGYERKISLTEGYYDLLVRLNSIISPSEVNLTVQKIAEPILVTGSVTTSSDSNVGEETLSPEEQKKASTFLVVLVSTIIIGVGVTVVLIRANIKPLKKKNGK